MEGDTAIYDEIAAGGEQVGAFIEELRCQGRSEKQISHGIAAARARRARCNEQSPQDKKLSGNSGIQLHPIGATCI